MGSKAMGPNFVKTLTQILLVSSFCLIINAPLVSTANVVVLCPMCSRSHKNIFLPIISALGERGHNVTVVSAWETHGAKDSKNTNKNSTNNIHDIIPQKGFDLFPNANMYTLRSGGMFLAMFIRYDHCFETCHRVYQNEGFKSLNNMKIDLILVDTLLNDCLMGFIYKSGAPFVSVSTAPPLNMFTKFLGNRLPPSFVQNPYLTFTHSMTFWQRFVNTVFDQFISWRMDDYFFTNAENVYMQYMDVEEGGSMPGIREIVANVSFMLSNSHFALTFPRPTMPDVLEIGGIHCRPGQPLSKDLEDFASGGKEGFILFSLGSIFNPHELPAETLEVFLNVFSKLKQRVLWKLEGDPISNLPPNVKVSKWIPQQDLLAHKNIKLFITHGGLLSTQEAVYHSVPILGIPMFGDQDLNIGKAEMAGIALSVEVMTITEKELEDKIHQILEDSRIADRLKTLSGIFRDHLETPLERALYWLEYLIRYKGAPHLRSAARDLNFFQYYCLDVTAVIFIIFSAALFTTKVFMTFLLRKLIARLHGSCKSAPVEDTIILGGKKEN